MLTRYFLQFKESISIFNLFEYLTFKIALSAITALLISFIIGPIVIKNLKKYQIGEEIRTNGPKSHLAKKGTPTMGGVIIIFASLLPTLFFSDLNNTMVIIVLLSTFWMGAIGFIDDYLKIIIKTKSGMVARYKLLGQIILGGIIAYIIINSNDFNKPRPKIISNVTSEEADDVEQLKSLLIKQIESRVRWRESINYMVKNNVSKFIEIGPGKVLCGLLKRIDKNLKAVSINSIEDIKQIGDL